VKAISLWQPWASLIACGAKPYETRSWAPSQDLIGQRIAIHAAKKIDKGAAQFAQEIMYGQHKEGGFALAACMAATFNRTPEQQLGRFGMTMMPIGAVVCTAVLEAAFQLGPQDPSNLLAARVGRRLTSKPEHYGRAVRYDDWGDYSEGRWAWLLGDVQLLNPAPALKGAQGFFELPAGWAVS
jgi:hypothetical protein